MPPRPTVVVLVALVVLVTGCSNTGSGGAPTGAASGSTEVDPALTGPAASTTPPVATPATATSTSAPRPEPVRVRVECPDDFDDGIECSTVEMPADRAHPDDGSVVLPVAIAPAIDPTARGSAIVIPVGGPGFAGLGLAHAYLDSPLRNAHDIVAYDQRGTGLAEPSLECPERDEAAIATLQAADPPPDERARVASAMLECRERLVDDGVDLDDYDTEASAADLDDLRQVLGYDRWTILGMSYGARLALATMRSFPDGVGSVVLDSVYDVTDGGLAATVAAAGHGIDNLVLACASDPACAGRYPDLAGSIDAVRSLYNAAPWRGEVQIDPASPARPFVITGDDIVGGLFQALQDATLIPLLPSIIVALQAGDASVLPAFVEQSMPRIVDMADAMFLAFECADNAGVPGLAERDAATVAADVAGGRFSTLVTLGYAPLCDEWDVPPTSPNFNEPVTADIPALVLAGSFDPITPPAGSEAAAAALPGSTFAQFADQGHGVTGGGACQDAMTLAFLADPAAPVDTSCAAAVPAPAWV